MSYQSRYLSTLSLFVTLCGLCIGLASLAYVCMPQTFGSMVEKQIPSPAHQGQANCSHSILRSFYKTYNAFPESGGWLSDPKSKTSALFEPSICKFRKCDVFNMFIMKSITYVLFLGDSQGRNSFVAARKYITSSSDVSCTSVRFSNRGQFFSRDGVKLLNADDKKGVFCLQCVVTTILCKRLGYNLTVKMQFIRIALWSEAVNVSGYHNVPTFQCPFVEFIFKYYLRNNQPDLVVVFSLFNHLKSRMNITKSDFVNHFMPLRSLVQSALPQTSRVQWLTNPMEFESARKGASLKHQGVLYDGHLAGEIMTLFSRWMFDALADVLIKPDSNHLGFFNVANMTSSLVKQSRDGIHLGGQWYDKWMAYMLETMCHGL